MIKQLTLGFVVNSRKNSILLGMKKRGFGEGKWNGFGGKVESNDESIERAVVREIKEECGLNVEHVTKLGILEFEFADVESSYSKKANEVLEVHVFRTEYSEESMGVAVESDEMMPKWFDFDQIPYDKMWIDDRYWLQHVIHLKLFKGHFLFQGHDRILSHSLEFVDKF
jgi:ADP-ribose pyrophosphatase YjhB (NUDIX family)